MRRIVLFALATAVAGLAYGSRAPADDNVPVAPAVWTQVDEETAPAVAGAQASGTITPVYYRPYRGWYRGYYSPYYRPYYSYRPYVYPRYYGGYYGYRPYYSGYYGPYGGYYGGGYYGAPYYRGYRYW
jgi:hypothetical protein